MAGRCIYGFAMHHMDTPVGSDINAERDPERDQASQSASKEAPQHGRRRDHILIITYENGRLHSTPSFS